MNLFEYQQLAARTIPDTLHGERLYLNAVLGMNGEAGEMAADMVTFLKAVLGLNGATGKMADMLKKKEFQGHAYTEEQKVNEAGDVLWYVAAACTALGVSLEMVAQANIEKLRQRYPDGFSAERSVNRDTGPASLNAVENEHNVEPETGDIVNWHWLGDEVIRYPQPREVLTLVDYAEGTGL